MSTRRKGLWATHARRTQVITASALAAACVLAPVVGSTAANAAPNTNNGSANGTTATKKPTAKPTSSPTPTKKPAQTSPAQSGNESDSADPTVTASPKPTTTGKPVADKPVKAPEDHGACDQNAENGITGANKKPLPDACDPAKEDAKKKAQDLAASVAAAQELLASAEAELEKEAPKYEAAKKRKKQFDKRYRKLAPKVAEAEAELIQFARKSYMMGVDPNILTQVATLDADDPMSYQVAQSTISRIGSLQANDVVAARDLIERVKQQKEAADAEFAAMQASHQLIEFNMAVAKNTLGLASGLPEDPAVAKFFDDYPVQPCAFVGQVNTTRSCTDAQKFVLHEVGSPSKSWYNLCLNLVTIAYGAPQSIPRAIDMWNGLPAEVKHSPNTVAPPGALMFWAPNHVAMSLGNNMLVSNDVLGNGRVWIVPFSTIQTRWNMPYLGWTEPDFRNA